MWDSDQMTARLCFMAQGPEDWKLNHLSWFRRSFFLNYEIDENWTWNICLWCCLYLFSTFYVISDKELNAQNHRISVKAESDSVDISSGCSPTNGLPTAVETIVLVKKGVYSCVSLQIAWLIYQAKHRYMVQTKSHKTQWKYNWSFGDNLFLLQDDGKKTSRTIQLN